MSVATLRLTKNGAGEVLHDPMASKVVAHEIAHLLGAEHDGGFSQVKKYKAFFFLQTKLFISAGFLPRPHSLS